MFALVVALLAVCTLPIAARLWRAGRVSDRAMTLVVVSLAPLSCLLYALLTGASPVVLGLTALVALPGVLLYRTLLDLIREQGDQIRSARG